MGAGTASSLSLVRRGFTPPRCLDLRMRHTKSLLTGGTWMDEIGDIREKGLPEAVGQLRKNGILGTFSGKSEVITFMLEKKIKEMIESN